MTDHFSFVLHDYLNRVSGPENYLETQSVFDIK